MVSKATELAPASEQDVSDAVSRTPEILGEVGTASSTSPSVDTSKITARIPENSEPPSSAEPGMPDVEVIPETESSLLWKLTAKLPGIPSKAAIAGISTNAKAMIGMAIVTVVSIVGAVVVVSIDSSTDGPPDTEDAPSTPGTLGPGIEGVTGPDFVTHYPISSSIPFNTDSELLKRMREGESRWKAQPLLPSLFAGEQENKVKPELPTPPATDEATPGLDVPQEVKNRIAAFKPGEIPGTGRPWRDYLAVLKNALDLPKGIDCNLETCWLLLNSVIDPQFDAAGHRAHMRRLSEKLDTQLATATSTEQAIRRLVTFMNSEFTVASDSRPLSLPSDVLAGSVKPASSSPAAMNLIALALVRRLAESSLPSLSAQELHLLGYARRIQGRTILTYDGRVLGRNLYRNADFTQAGTNHSDKQLALAISDADILAGHYLKPLTNREFFATLISELAPTLADEKSKALLLEIVLDERRGDVNYRDGWLILAMLKLKTDDISDLERLVAMHAQGIGTKGIAEQVLALRAEQAGELEAARDAALQALQSDEQNSTTLHLLARIHFALADLQTATEYAQKARAAANNLHTSRKTVLYELSLNIALAGDDTKAALQALELLSGVDSARASELVNLGRTLRRRLAIRKLADDTIPTRVRFESLGWLLPKLKLNAEQMPALIELAALLGNTGNTEIDWRIANRLKILTGQNYKLNSELWQAWLTQYRQNQ